MRIGLRNWLAGPSGDGMYYGWIIVLVMFFSNIITYSTLPSFGLFVTPLENEFGWSRSMVAMAQTLGTVVGAGLSPFFGMLLDRVSVRVLMAGGGVLASGCFFLLSQVQSLWQFYLLYAVQFGVITTCVGVMLSNVMVTRWFVRRRGRAMGLVMMGASAGSFIFVMLNGYLISEYGWRTAYQVQGVMLLVQVCVPALLFMVSSPEEFGLKAHPELQEEGRAPGEKRVVWKVAEAVRTRTFWLTLAGVMMGSMVVGGYFTHAVPHMEQMGFSRAYASSLWGAFFLVGMISKPIWGLIIERTGVRLAMVFLFIGEALGLGILVYAYKPWHLVVFAIVMGLGNGPFLQLMAQTWGDFFGRASIGPIYGTVQPAIMLANALSPLLGGVLFDWQGNYIAFLWVLIGLSLLACFLFMFVRIPVHPSLKGAG